MTTHAPPSTSSSNIDAPLSGFKRRRLSSQKNKEELAYTASTIQKKAFILGDKREHALPIGCGVDMCTVKLVTAAEYDDDDRWSISSNSDEGRQLQSNQLQQQHGQQEEDCKCKDETGEFSSNNKNNMNDAAVIEMQMYANLVTSTRQLYYTDDLALATKSTSKRRSTATASNTTKTTATTNGNLRSSSPNSSEGNSTWSASLLEDTTTTLNDLNVNHAKKNIDNDNRSDGQSSNMGNYGWYSSDDSVSSSNSSDDDDDDDENESKKYEENEEEILRQQCDLGHQQVQEQQQRHDNDKVHSGRLHCLDEPYSVVG